MQFPSEALYIFNQKDEERFKMTIHPLKKELSQEAWKKAEEIELIESIKKKQRLVNPSFAEFN